MDYIVLSNDTFFDKHPDPMWLYDRETLNFLAVNDAAVLNYGYSREEFLKLTIADIRPAEDVTALHETLSKEPRGLSEAKIWRHKVKSGRIIFVSIRSSDLGFDNKKVSMISARDVTSLIEGEFERAKLLTWQHKLAQRLTDTLENLSEGFVTLNKDLVFTFINREGEKLLNRKKSDLLGTALTTAYPDEQGKTFEAKYLQSLETGEVAQFTDYYPAPVNKWFEVRAYPASDGLAVHFRDVTQKRAKEGQLQVLEKAVSHLNDIIIITTAESIDEPEGPVVVFVNEAFSRHTGYSLEEILGKTPRMLQGPNTQRDRLDAMRRSMMSWQPHRTELINYTKSGEEIWLDIEIVPVADDTGHFTHWVSVQRDITERKRAAEAQRLDHARFETIAKAVNDVVWEWDLGTDGLWWSEALKTSFGHDPDQMDNSILSWKDNIHPDDKLRVVSKIELAIKGADENWEDEYRFTKADGSHAIVVDRGYVIRDDLGIGVRMIGTMMDITERRELDLRLSHSQKLEALGQLTGGIAHDFNNLLTVIIGNTEILTAQLAKEPDKHALAELSFAAAERGAELTNRLLAFGRRQPLEPKLVDVGLLVQSLKSLLVRTLPENIELNIISLCQSCFALLDIVQLETALLNLVINARDAMPNGGQLTVRTDNVWLDKEPGDLEGVPAGNFVMVSVQDSGFGMDAETADRAFEPFFTTKEVGAGSGLGLSIVHGFVRQSSGVVKILAAPGVDTQVMMYFPIVATEATTQEYTEKKEEVSNFNICGDEKILVVEDDDMVRNHVTSHLADLGYTVISTANGKEALEALQQDEDIKLLFTDVLMPGKLNGGQLARKARRLRLGIKILITSGHLSNPDVAKGISGEEVFFLHKPYRLADLAKQVRLAIDASANQSNFLKA